MIADTADALHYVKENERYLYFATGDMKITIRKKDGRTTILDNEGQHFSVGKADICHLGIAIKFLTKLDELYHLHAPK